MHTLNQDAGRVHSTHVTDSTPGIFPGPGESIPIPAVSFRRREVMNSSCEGAGTLLLVEEETRTILDRKEILERNGYRVLTAHTDEEALDVLHTTPGIDLILMDIELGGGMDGAETAVKILDDRDLPVLFFVPRTRCEAVKKTGGVTSYGYIMEDAGEAVLVASVRTACRNFRKRLQEKNEEEALRESEARLQLAVQCAGIGLWDQDFQRGTVIRNREWAEMIGYTPEEIESGLHRFLALIHPDDLPRIKAIIREHEAGDVPFFRVEHRMRTKEGGWKWILNMGRIVQRDPEGKPIRAAGVHLDITDRKLAEQEIERQLAEKEVLLREVHHRIKNNIASVHGLLSLQAQSVTTPEARAVLQDAIGRVQSMRMLYDNLLLDSGYQNLSARRYLDALIDSIVRLFPEEKGVRIEKHLDDFRLDTRRLFYVGVIVNELLTNVMKHGFFEKSRGLIRIRAKKERSRVVLVVQDNGKGFPEGFGTENTKGLGLTLIGMLTQQLGGKITFENRDGARSVLVFDVNPK